jgi:hypothetical protein
MSSDTNKHRQNEKDGSSPNIMAPVIIRCHVDDTSHVNKCGHGICRDKTRTKLVRTICKFCGHEEVWRKLYGLADRWDSQAS